MDEGKRGNIVALVFFTVLLSGAFLVPMMWGIDGGPAPTRTNMLHVGTGQTYSTIQSAVDAASTGDLIIVHNGTYNEDVLVDKTLEIAGEKANRTTVRGTGAGNTMEVTADDCNISGLTFKGSWKGDNWIGGLALSGENAKVHDCVFTNNNMGLVVNHSSGHKVYDCELYENDLHGVFLGGGDNKGEKCRFDRVNSHHNGGSGFAFFVASDNKFYECNADYNGGDGWNIFDSELEYIRFCTANHNDRSGFDIFEPFDANCLFDNEILGNGANGILFTGEGKQFIHNNTIAENKGRGIMIENNANSEGRADIFSNLIINNSMWAIEITPGPSGSSIAYTDIINNNPSGTPQVSDNGSNNDWDDSAIGNFWSDWTTPDSNSDGIVDNPYNVAGTASSKDNYPTTTRHTTHSYTPGGGGGQTSHPPVMQVYPPDYATVGQTYEVTLDVYDPDTPKNQLNWGLIMPSGWLSIVGSKVTGIPWESDIGENWFVIWVSDGENLHEENFTVTVVAQLPPDKNEYPPEIFTQPITDAYVGELYYQIYNATDPDTSDRNLEWSMFTSATFLNMTGSNLSGIPTSADKGTYSVSVMVSDGEFTDIVTFDLMVHYSIPGDDDDDEEPTVIDISPGLRLETGESVFDAEDMTEGAVIIVEYQWYIDGELVGNGSKLVIELEPGEHILKLRSRGQDGTWYEVTRTIRSRPFNDESDIQWILIVPAVLLIVVIILSTTILAFFIINRRRSRSQSGQEEIEWEEDEVVAIEIPEPSPPAGPRGPAPRVESLHYNRRIPDSVTGGTMDMIEEPFPREVERAEINRGPADPGSYILTMDDLDEISLEALSWKRPSRFTMKRKKMLEKLENKRRVGEVDEDLYRELREFIKRNMS